MKLTRRDALAALAAAGAVGAGAAVGRFEPPVADDAGGGDATGDGAEDVEELLRTLTAAAEVLYPSAASGHRAFVETYVIGRIEDREVYRERVAAAAAELDATAREWYDGAYADLSVETRDSLLRELGADTAEPDPGGTVSGRLRYFVVDELLFAFYASPAGGRLVGIENPPGYPGGIESYRRASPDERSPQGDESASKESSTTERPSTDHPLPTADRSGGDDV
jgi:hypothetical protein